ncbi:hypothetical protein L209DRAFT_270874 [Thermothelomyces heterothallicus CBS 203.75]
MHRCAPSITALCLCARGACSCAQDQLRARRKARGSPQGTDSTNNYATLDNSHWRPASSAASSIFVPRFRTLFVPPDRPLLHLTSTGWDLVPNKYVLRSEHASLVSHPAPLRLLLPSTRLFPTVWKPLPLPPHPPQTQSRVGITHPRERTVLCAKSRATTNQVSYLHSVDTLTGAVGRPDSACFVYSWPPLS